MDSPWWTLARSWMARSCPKNMVMKEKNILKKLFLYHQDYYVKVSAAVSAALLSTTGYTVY